MYNEDTNINDYYKIKKDFAELKKLVDSMETDIEVFLSYKKVISRSIAARMKMVKARKLLVTLGKKVLKTRQDFESDYS